MFMKRTGKRSKLGFGMLELIIVLAVVAILGTVGVVEVAQSKKGLEQKELDSYAEVIYHAMQSRLTELRTSGRESVYLTEAGGTPAPVTGLTKIPADFVPVGLTDGNGFKNDKGESEMCYLVVPTAASGTERTDLMNKLMPENRDDVTLWSGSWVIEFNYKTAMVYSVFFSETDSFADYDLDEFNYLRGEASVRRKCEDPKVGYYSSGVADTEQDTTHLSPEVKVTNGETLTASFTCPVPDGFNDNIKFYYRIVQEDGNWVYPGKDELAETQVIEAKDGVYTFNALTLDDPLGGNAFQNLWKDGKGTLKPGSKMTIELEAAGVTKPTTSDQDEDQFNSLFADSSKTPEAEIANPRHLQNLEPTISGVNPDKKNPDITAAKLLDDVKWPNNTPFTPILNEPLKTFDGNNKDIKNLPESLFDTFKGNEVKDLDLVNPKVYNKETTNLDNKGYAGALARVFTGNSKGAKITNVGAYLVEDGKPSVENQDAWDDGDYAIVATKRGAGGLIGKANGSKIIMTNCYAALTIQSKSYTGGLIGHIYKANVTMTNCYSDSYVFGKFACGLIGYVTGTEDSKGSAAIQSCYAAGYLYGSNEKAGYQAGIAMIDSSTGSLTAKSAYTVCEFMGLSKKDFATVNGGTLTDMYYLIAGDTNKGTEITAEQRASIADFATTLGGAFDKTAQASNAYNLLDQGLPDTYEYPGIVGLIHYCDWGPIGGSSAITVTVDNGEKLLANFTAAVEGNVSDTIEVAYTVSDGTHKYDGTCTLTKDDAGVWSGSAALDDLTSAATQFKTQFPDITPGTDCSITITGVTGARWDEENSTKDAVSFNSLFASVSNGTAHIAYGRHLQNLDPATSGVTSAITAAVVDQDIYFKKSDSENPNHSWLDTYGAKTFKPIENNENLLSVNGANKSIYDITITGSYVEAAVFGTFGSKNDGKARSFSDLTLVRPNVSTSYSDSDAAGFVGYYIGTGSLTGCDVINATIYAPIGNAAGLVGCTSGVITVSDCQVYLDDPTQSLTDFHYNSYSIVGANACGGLIGCTYNTSTEITNSFSAVVVGDSAFTPTGTKKDYVSGGLVGRASAITTTIKNCYADCYVYGNRAGGLVGYRNAKMGSTQTNLNIEYCYAAGYLYGKNQESGFAYADTHDNLTVKHSYTITKPSGKTDYYATINRGSCDTAYYASAGVNTTNKGTLMTSAQKNDAAGLANILGGNFTAPTSVTPYNLMGQGLTAEDFSTPVLSNLAHYGDWYQTDGVQTGFVYYEKYSDGSVGLYYPDGTNTLKKLEPNAEVKVVGDGYGVVFSKADRNGTATITGSNSTTLSVAAKAGPVIELTANGKGAVVCGLPASWMNPKTAYNYDQNAHSKNIYSSVSVNYSGISHAAENYKYIPFYAKAFYATNIDTSALPTNQAIIIRSPRQLYSLSWLYTMYQGTDGTDGTIAGAKAVKGSYFSQETDLIYDTYDWQTFTGVSDYGGQQAIGSRHNNFISNYEGNNHYVKNVKLTGRYNNNMNYTNAGLFGYVDTYKTANTSTTTYTYESSARTTISNLHLVTDQDITISKSAFAGAFVSVVQDAVVQNCSVTGYNVTYDTDDGYSVASNSAQNCIVRIGGFAGNVERGGTVKNCYTDNVDVQVTQTMTAWTSTPGTGSHYYAVGGFVGWMGDEEGSWKDAYGANVTNCYAGGTITSNNSSAESVAVAFGTFAGRIRMDSHTNCKDNFANVVVKKWTYTQFGKTKTLTPKIFAFANYNNFKSTDYTKNNCPYNPADNGYLDGCGAYVPSSSVLKRGTAVSAANMNSFLTSHSIAHP